MFDLDLSIGVQLLAGLIFSGGAGYVAYRVVGKIKESKPDLSPDVTRLVAWVITLLVAWAAYGVLLWLGVYEVPVTDQDLFLTLMSVGFVAITSSQGFHAKNELRDKPVTIG